MRKMLSACVVGLSLLLGCDLTAQAGPLSKVKSKAKAAAHKVGDKAEDVGDATQDKVKQADRKVDGKERLQRSDKMAKQAVDQQADVFKKIMKD